MLRSSHQMFYVNISSLLRESDDPLTLAGGEDLKRVSLSCYDDTAKNILKLIHQQKTLKIKAHS